MSEDTFKSFAHFHTDVVFCLAATFAPREHRFRGWNTSVARKALLARLETESASGRPLLYLLGARTCCALKKRRRRHRPQGDSVSVPSDSPTSVAEHGDSGVIGLPASESFQMTSEQNIAELFQECYTSLELLCLSCPRLLRAPRGLGAACAQPRVACAPG